ncbi:phosphatase PAP2 family protein [Agrobacterium rosae]|uniref:phosphatase PAP2 family protein n=1 Tax=Agrobacterium rosae TaxID=1972867 RepID=UPI002A0FB324|nr:phosphatase PAP2 family protein [Agrobacterium rosae]MDX8313644.1 phosphatase PAP2 family protein [Agrobacterium rosae]
MRLLPAERVLILIIGVLAALDAVLLAYKQVGLDWAGYFLPVFMSAALFFGGQYYRVVRCEERLALALGASGLFIFFTLVTSIFNYLLLPIHFPVMDNVLVKLDAAMGYDWPSLVVWFSQWPTLSRLLLFVYFSSLPQLILAILLLGLSGQERMLWHFLLTGILGVLGCIAVWAIFPSFGASSVHELSQSVLDAVPVAVSPQYSAEVLRLSRDGAHYISPANVLGLIGFPSFHTVMACMAVVFMARFKWIFPFVALVNIAMVLAILVHGGHHLSDVFGGIVMFVVAYLLAGKLLSRLSASDTNSLHKVRREPL